MKKAKEKGKDNEDSMMQKSFFLKKRPKKKGEGQ